MIIDDTGSGVVSGVGSGLRNTKETKETKEAKEKEKTFARMEAMKQLEYERIKEKREKEERERKESRGLSRRSYNKLYNINVYYKTEEYAGDKIFKYMGPPIKNNINLILVGDRVQYNNPKHPNHLKYGAVRSFSFEGTTSDPSVKFVVIFDDPPFIYEKNEKTGQTYKTNKKIKVIDGINFRKLHKISGLEGFQIKVDSGVNTDYNKRKFLETHSKTDRNTIIRFYRLIIELMDKDVNEVPPGYNTLSTWLKDKDRSTELKNKDRPTELRNKDRSTELTFFQFRKLFNMTLVDFKNTLSAYKTEQNVDNEIITNSFEFLNVIMKEFKLKKRDFKIKTKLDFYILIRNRLEKKEKILNLKLETFQDKFEKEIIEKIRRKFIKNDRFYPSKVQMRYTNNTSLEGLKSLFKDQTTLVEPTDDKTFTIDGYSFDDLKQQDDYIGNTVVVKKFTLDKIADSEEPGEISIQLNLKLYMTNTITDIELLDENERDSAIRMLSDFVTNIKNKFDCAANKAEFNKNLQKLEKMAFSNPLKSNTKTNAKTNEKTDVYEFGSISQKITPTVTYRESTRSLKTE